MSSQVRIQPDSGLWSLARSSRPTSRSAASRTFSGRSACFDPGAEVVGAVGFALAEFLADRGQLLAQQELALGLLHAVADVVTDLLGDVHLGQVRPGPADQQLQTGCHVGGLEDLALLLVGQVRRPAGGVGQHGRVGHLLDGVDHLPGVPLLQVGDDQRLVFGGKLFRAVGDGLVVDQFGLHPQRGAGAGDAGADPGAPSGAQHRGGSAAGQPADLLDGGDDAECGIAVLQARGEQHLADAVA